MIYIQSCIQTCMRKLLTYTVGLLGQVNFVGWSSRWFCLHIFFFIWSTSCNKCENECKSTQLNTVKTSGVIKTQTSADSRPEIKCIIARIKIWFFFLECIYTRADRMRNFFSNWQPAKRFLQPQNASQHDSSIKLSWGLKPKLFVFNPITDLHARSMFEFSIIWQDN